MIGSIIGASIKSSFIVHRSSIVHAVFVTGLLTVAVLEALRVTTGLHLPPDPDLFRSAAITQTIADGGWTADPFFAGEANWYNPLVPAIVAVLHGVTGTPILELYARAGVALNLLVPIAFWALVRVVFGSPAAVAAVFAFLFLPPRQLPGWSTAGYWPWLFSGVFTQALFYLGLLAADRAGRAMRLSRWLLAGAALGVVFLGHTAPALILGGVLVLTAARLWRRGCSARRAALMLMASLLVASLVSLPLIAAIAVRYRFAVVNDVLALWSFPETEPANIIGFLGDHANAGGVLALVGLGLLAFDRERRQRAWVVGCWGVVNGLLLFVHFTGPLLEELGVRVPQFVTAFHFVLYAEAIVTILAGYGIWRIVELTARIVPRPSFWSTDVVVARVLLLAILAASVRPALPNRRAREDFDESRARALQYESRHADRNARDWIRAHTEPGTVFLASDRLSLYVVAPAGGKVVSVEAVFANPYVDVARRDRDRFQMEDRIQEKDLAGYCAVAPRYEVKYVVTETSRPEEPPFPRGTFLEEVHAADVIHIFRAPACAGPDPSAGRHSRRPLASHQLKVADRAKGLERRANVADERAATDVPVSHPLVGDELVVDHTG
jgi:hypothetical protein